MNFKVALTSLALLFATPAMAEVDIVVKKSTQTMDVYFDGERIYSWPVSTARRGYTTPVGEFQPYYLDPMHYSKKYDNAPMPHSIFFSGGYAIHATPHIGNLGRPASHGCVRLHPTNALALYNLVKGMRSDTYIHITN